MSCSEVTPLSSSVEEESVSSLPLGFLCSGGRGDHVRNRRHFLSAGRARRGAGRDAAAPPALARGRGGSRGAAAALGLQTLPFRGNTDTDFVDVFKRRFHKFEY